MCAVRSFDIISIKPETIEAATISKLNILQDGESGGGWPPDRVASAHCIDEQVNFKIIILFNFFVTMCSTKPMLHPGSLIAPRGCILLSAQ